MKNYGEDLNRDNAWARDIPPRRLSGKKSNYKEKA
jgi:hypothetical protein